MEIDRHISASIRIFFKSVLNDLDNNRKEKLCIFIGAGTSLTSNNYMTFDKLKKSIVDKYYRLGSSLTHEEYATNFDELMGEREVRNTLKEFVEPENSNPSEGHIYMAMLCNAKIFDSIITTNFDCYLEKGSEIAFGKNIYEVLVPHKVSNHYRLRNRKSNNQMLLKLHGDFDNGVEYITSEELSSKDYEETIAKLIGEIFLTHDTIFMGYSGQETQLTKIFTELQNNPLYTDRQIYWFNPSKLDSSVMLHKGIGNQVGLSITAENTDSESLYFDNIMRDVITVVLEEKPNLIWDMDITYCPLYLLDNRINFRNEKVEQISTHGYEYIDNLYVNRDEAQRVINDFLQSDQSMLNVTGKSGYGKTTLLKRIVKTKLGGNLFCYISAKSLPMNLTSYNSIFDSVFGIKSLNLLLTEYELGKQNKKLVIVIDGINEYSAEFTHCANLYKVIFSLACHISEQELNNIKIISSFRNETYSMLRQMYNEYITNPIIYHSGQPINLNSFNEKEFLQAFEKYKVHYRVTSSFDDLLLYAKERLMDPFMLNLTFSARSDARLSIMDPSVLIFEKYLREVLVSSGLDFFKSIRLLTSISKKCLEKGETKLSQDTLLSINDFNDMYLRIFCDLGILEVRTIKSSLSLSTYIYWGHDRFIEYFLFRVVLEGFDCEVKTINNILNDSISYIHLYSALKNSILLFIETNIENPLHCNTICGIFKSTDQKYRNLTKEILFELSQISPITYHQLCSMLLDNISYDEILITSIIQGASFNPQCKITLKYVSKKLNESQNLALIEHLNFVITSLTIKEIQQLNIDDTTSNDLANILGLDSEPTIRNILHLILLITRLGETVAKGNEGLIPRLLAVLIENVTNLSEEEYFLMIYNEANLVNRYFFNGTEFGDYLSRSSNLKKEMQTFIEVLWSDENLINQNIFNKIYTNKIEKQLYRCCLVIALKNEELRANYYAQLDEQMQLAKSARDYNTITSKYAYISLFSKEYNLKRARKLNEAILKSNLAEFLVETSYKRLFNPIGTYGFIHCTVKPGTAIDLYCEYYMKFSTNNDEGCLRILHALRQSISQFPKEVLLTLKEIVDVDINKQTRKRVLQLLAELFTKYPDLTYIFLLENEASFSMDEINWIRFGAEEDVFSHPITILEWCRIFQIFDNNLDNEAKYKTLSRLNNFSK